jgi:uncharacterized protein YrzB (UPF0473 family)
MEKQYITLINDDGSETLAEILFTYHSEEFNKNYVVFLPQDGEGVAAASYVENGNQGSLEQITTEEAQYRYLKELNKKLTLFKKQSDQSGKKDEETEQTMRR